MLQPPLAATAAAVDGDADYARNELTAFAASWLRTLAPRVVNEPTPQGLCGRWRAPLHWRVLAREAGLPVAPYAFDSRRPPPLGDDGTPSTQVLAVGGEPLRRRCQRAIRAAAARLARAAAHPSSACASARTARAGWRLLDATPHPDLSGAGEDGIAALEAVLAA